MPSLGKSVESALHTVEGTIEKSLQEKDYTLAAFLDIKRAFNNVKTESVKSAFESLGRERLVIRWAESVQNFFFLLSKKFLFKKTL